ncbi:ATP-binding protein, partial [Amaricoccus sp.]|uniref:ATP-binding protein n=1 Tax=Amaricoccus sp. TaxID=1872485 RepID=UPI0026271274
MNHSDQMMLTFGLLAGFLQLVGYLLYIRDEEIEPNPVTWLMFAYGTALLTFLEWDREASAAELALPVVCSSMALFVAGRCWWRARRQDPSRYWPREWWPEDWRDRASFQADLVLTGLYLAAAALAYSRWIDEEARGFAVVIFLIAANLTTLTAFFPLLRNVVADPSHERPLPWAIWASAYALLGATTFAIQGEIWSELMLYPLLNMVLHGSVALLARRSRRERVARVALGVGPEAEPAPAAHWANRAAGEGDDEDDALRLSHRLVALHAGGIVLLILVVLGTALWISAQHNRLALDSSKRLVESELEAVRTSTYTLVRDYSIWDQGFAAVMNDDREWLYSSIGSSVTELGTFDLAILIPEGRTNFGWIAGSPPEGEVDILPAPLLGAILGLLDTKSQRNARLRTLLAEFDGSPWFFAVSRMTLVEGLPPGVTRGALPVQIHGTRLTEERLGTLGRDLLATKLTLSQEVPEGMASVALVDFKGDVITNVVWDAPRPGANILRKAAIPLALALLVATAISAVSSLYAVRSARRLERALVAAKAADRSRTEFLSNVSHELRTPMNGVLGATQLLAMTGLDEEQRELVDLLLSSANAQMSLISDLIDVSRIDSGNRKLESMPFEPETVLGEVTDMMKVTASRKGIRLEADWTEIRGLTVRGDAQALRQILTNLVGNAVKFTDAGGVGVHAALERGAQAKLTVTVADTGPGIPEAALPRIFERFFQVDSSMSRVTEGTGLGLAISEKLVQAMGGEITVSSELGAGSTFVFTAVFDEAAR